ncbi:hypothetical protein SOVF_174550 isoform A [Spinacia oleracea]|uniref:Multiple organellar RNA editing factor 3, mitochondrial isoform X1 n=1 Tax=Spinacia oleracea TaxID=3562 RepID=A0ABM3RAS8_SPIOL|nr:multiple organellar RNA editing factor 3, mitochondrial-like isoform X1 [Spinacia oleracea]KNA07146.1 hypothetical protein SOVF_174550 isoform A [Spinacia oleracea]
MEFPTDPKPSNEEIIDSYVNTLNPIVGSEKEAKKIYSVSTTTYTGYGALISKEMTYKVKVQLKDKDFHSMGHRKAAGMGGLIIYCKVLLFQYNQ